MQTYTDEVLPACPKEHGCSCTIQFLSVSHNIYSVKVSCRGKQMTSFPKLPKNTRYLDLTDNKVYKMITVFYSIIPMILLRLSWLTNHS